MAWWCQLLIAVIPALITGIITLVIARKSQLNKNSEIIKEIKESNEQSFKSIKEDIGRGGLSSLTEQHNNLQKEIARDFSTIQQRYDKEDAAYSKYSRQQLDIEGSVKAYLEEYKRLINLNNDLINRNVRLENEIETLKKQLQQYQSQEQNISKGFSR